MNGLLDLMITFAVMLAFAASIVSGLNELILSLWGARGRYLRLVLHRMLDFNHQHLSVGLFRKNTFKKIPAYDTVADELLRQPLISAAAKSPNLTMVGGRPTRELPSHIPEELFASALLDVLKAHGMTITVEQGGVLLPRFPTPTIPHPDLQAFLVKSAAGKTSQADWLKDLGSWFTSIMSRATWRYRQGLRLVSLGIGVVLSAALNLRPVELVSAISKLSEQNPLAGADFSKALWWNGTWDATWPFEWLLAGLLVGLGGPFWFDLAGRVKGFKHEP